jgi:hypothetical protein
MTLDGDGQGETLTLRLATWRLESLASRISVGIIAVSVVDFPGYCVYRVRKLLLDVPPLVLFHGKRGLKVSLQKLLCGKRLPNIWVKGLSAFSRSLYTYLLVF